MKWLATPHCWNLSSVLHYVRTEGEGSIWEAREWRRGQLAEVASNGLREGDRLWARRSVVVRGEGGDVDLVKLRAGWRSGTELKFGVEDVDLSVDVRVAMGEDGTGSRGRRGGRGPSVRSRAQSEDAGPGETPGRRGMICRRCYGTSRARSWEGWSVWNANPIGSMNSSHSTIRSGCPWGEERKGFLEKRGYPTWVSKVSWALGLPWGLGLCSGEPGGELPGAKSTPCVMSTLRVDWRTQGEHASGERPEERMPASSVVSACGPYAWEAPALLLDGDLPCLCLLLFPLIQALRQGCVASKWEKWRASVVTFKHA